ncbi:MAG: glycine--tRNA ligase [Candidatus Nanohaloarchaea archaeon]
MTDDTGEVTELAKRRGFFLPSNEIYGGTAGFYTYGPRGAPMKSNIEDEWRERFTYREGHREIDAPTVMPEAVFEASGHLETFDDMIIECPGCGKSHRADHLVEDNTEVEEAEAFSTERIMEIISDEDIQCPDCGEALAGEEVDDFNLMFSTNIGPGDSSPGYLRPETAQGIFVEFPQLKEYARNQLPFGITQVGKAYRNEISPRKSLVRVREFTQAELEHFIDPERDEPGLEKVEDVKVTLYPRSEQDRGGGEEIVTTVGEAVEKDIIASDWVAYYVGISKRWYEKVGVNMDKFRFRQHQEDELSHYASDCWDAEAYTAGTWVELAGFAYRGCYDLKNHQEHSGEDFTVFREYDEPREEEVVDVSVDMGELGPEFGSDAGDVAEAVEESVKDHPSLLDQDTLEVDLNGEVFDVDTDWIEREEVEKTINGENIMAAVVEPSFGIGRLFYTVLDHSLEEDEVDGEQRTVLRLEPDVAPVEVAVFPLMDKDGMGEKAEEVAESLRAAGFSVDYDDSGAIGRRYRRQDEIGTPLCVTVDHETLEDGTVTLRDRDSTEQVRVPVEELEQKIQGFMQGAGLGEL